MARTISINRAKELIAVASREFADDGGLGYTQRVLRSLDEGSILFNPSEACFVLTVLHQSMMSEYGRLVAQLEDVGAKVVPTDTPVGG